MDEGVQAEIERQQNLMLDKLSSVMDTKMGQMKRELEDVASKAHDSQMHEIKRMKFTEPRTFKKKGHEQQYKHSEQVKNTVEEAKEAVQTQKYDACIKKLDEGIELIEQRQKLILMADRSEYGWKTVGEYTDNELADNDEDAKKMKKAEKEAQRKLAEARATKMARGRGVWNRRAPRVTATSTQSQYNGPVGNTIPQNTLPVNINRGVYSGSYARRTGVCFGCGKQGHWRNECPVATLSDGQQQGGRKLSTLDYEFLSTVQLDDTKGTGEGIANGDEPIDVNSPTSIGECLTKGQSHPHANWRQAQI